MYNVFISENGQIWIKSSSQCRTLEADTMLNFKSFTFSLPLCANWHLQIMLCQTPDYFTHQLGTPQEWEG